MKRVLLMMLLVSWSWNVSAEIIKQEIEYSAEGDLTLKGFVAYDSSLEGQRPGVLVVHEWWGHNQYARDRAVMLAEMGYVALAVDMYGEGKLAAHPEDAQKFLSAIAQDMPLAIARFKAAMQWLNAHPKSDKQHIAAIGYCFGGALVLQMAREGLDLDAVVSFHGSLPAFQQAQAKPKAKILVAHGAADPFIEPEHIIGFIQEMNGLGADYTFVAYGGALHSFTNPGADKIGAKFDLPLRYNKTADEASWRAMKTLFDEVFQ